MPGFKIDLNSNSLSSGKVGFTVTHEVNSLEVIPTPYGTVLKLDEYAATGKLGGPAFPSKVFNVALPPAAKAVRLEYKIVSQEAVGDGPIFVAPTKKPQPAVIKVEDEATYLKKLVPKKINFNAVNKTLTDQIPYDSLTLPDEELYKDELNNPRPVAVLNGTYQVGTTTIAAIEVTPVGYGNGGQVYFYTGIEIDVYYESTGSPVNIDSTSAPLVFKSIRNKTQAKKYISVAKDIVINSDAVIDISDYFHDFIFSLDYLIITDNSKWNAQTASPITSAGDLKTAFQRLADWKTEKGLKSSVVTVSDIVNKKYGDFSLCANGLQARDLQEIIRNFIKWAHKNWGISWVLLGGDADIIPVRLVPGACEGFIKTADVNPPEDNKSFYTGSYLRMHAVNPGTWWPGDTGRILVRPDTGVLIPYDVAGNLSTGWYYCTDNTYGTRTASVTQFVRVNGPASLVNADLQWIYQWNYIPTDLYYSSLVSSDYDKTGLHDWDLTNNGLYGQHNDNADLDGFVYEADVSVGRVPAGSVDQANAFVDKLIAYEQFRKPDGTFLNSDWPRKLTLVSSNWGGRCCYASSDSNPPPDYCYHHNVGNNYSIINTKDILDKNYTWRLIAQVSDTDIRYLPFDYNANITGFGWFYAKGPSNPTPSVVHINLGFVNFDFPIPTQWIAVYSSGSDLTPQYYISDIIGADGSMSDQEELRKQLDSDFPSVNLVTRIYEDEIDLPSADAIVPTVEHLTEDNVRNSLNVGPHFVSLSGHGNPGGCCWLGSDTASGLVNGYHSFIGFADSCLTNQFEGDAMSEHLLRNKNGGAVAYVGNTRFSWIGVGDDFQRAFFKTLKSTTHIGYMNDIRCTLINQSTGFMKLYTKWVIFSQNLLGDPEMEVWRGTPENLQVTHATSIYTGSQSFAVTVKKSGSPVADAHVTLKVEGGLYASGNTDSSGVVNLNINPASKGVMKVTVVAHGAIPYFGQVQINEKPSCGLLISCKNDILCGPKLICSHSVLVDCGIKLTCKNSLILTCNASLKAGCLNLSIDEFDRYKDILTEAKLKSFEELANKADTKEVGDAISRLSPEKAKEVRLLIDRVRNEK